MSKKILLLGSGELGKEFTISAQRYGLTIIAADKYENAPAMQVADYAEVIDMLSGDELQRIVDKHKVDIIVPEIEAIRTEKLFEFEEAGIQVVPSAKAVNFTMDRKAIRDLAAKDLGLKTAAFEYAKSEEELRNAAEKIGLPAVVKPLMSSSGKGQSVLKSFDDVALVWKYAIEGSRGDKQEVIIEEFIEFESEITLLTVTQKNGPTLFCPPIGHRQERGDYMESWQEANVEPSLLSKAQEMASEVCKALGGAGLWGVEFFLGKDEVYFSELSPRPHDTGMVSLSGSQNFSEFELHLRAVLGLDIPEIKLNYRAANAVILAQSESSTPPAYEGLEEVAKEKDTDFRIFGKPSTRPYRRMGIVICRGELYTPIDELREKAARIAAKVKVVNK
ncbi:MAG: formate-dependent phosphoribosylglycinamide formyltransferase [Flavobacteriales bacterium]|nr:formate-dependent phosphoribosylglycinamide formyltransferase [Flavobacteriales bacterium]